MEGCVGTFCGKAGATGHYSCTQVETHSGVFLRDWGAPDTELIRPKASAALTDFLIASLGG